MAELIVLRWRDRPVSNRVRAGHNRTCEPSHSLGGSSSPEESNLDLRFFTPPCFHLHQSSLEWSPRVELGSSGWRG